MLSNYLTVALRNLAKHRLFSLLTIVGMGIGVAAVGLMSLYVIHELSYDRFHQKANRIVRVAQYASWPGGTIQTALTSAPFADALKADYADIDKTIRINPEGGGPITYRDKKLDVDDILMVDRTMFDVFSFPFLYGDPATALAQPQSIVLTRSLAEKLFGNAANALGQTVEFSNHFPNRVTGVIADVPSNSHLQFSALRSMPANYTNGWQNYELYTYLLLHEGVDARSLEARLTSFFPKHLRQEMGDLDYRMALQPLSSIHLQSHLDFEISPNGSLSTIYTFILIAGLILLIAGINYVNLYTVRAIGRTREVGVRKAVGSGRGQLVGQFLTESILMAVLSGGVGLLVAYLVLPLFNELAGKALSLTQFGPLFTLGTVLVFIALLGLGSGLYPALLLSGFRPVMALKGHLNRQLGGHRFRQGLVVIQFVAAVALIACSWVIYRQMGYLRHKDLGFNREQVLTFHIDGDEVRRQVRVLKQELQKSPLIEKAAAASNPIGNNNIGNNGVFFEQNGTRPDHTQMVQTFSVDADFLSTLQIRLLRGRNFTESVSDQKGAVLVNEALVRKLGWQQPIGKRIWDVTKGDQVTEKRVVGVIRDFHTYSLQHKIEPLVLTMPAPSDQDNLYVRIQSGQTAEALAYIQSVFRTVDPAAELTFHFLDQNFSQQYKAEQQQARVLLSFTLLAVFIACLGLFGLVAFAAEQRTKEIGVRKVLGASVASIVALLSTDLLKLVLIAIVIAAPLARWAMQSWLQTFAYRIEVEWWVLALSGMLAVGIALLTVSFQSIKAALVNPVKSLRSE